MTPYFQTEGVTLYQGDCLDVLRALPSESVHAVVTDPPYGLAFMGKRWDYDVPSVEVWREVLRVLKPGGHLLSFGGTRTYHRMVVAIEDAGFEIRDQLAWLFGSGFPKSLDVSKAIDKAGGAEREVIGRYVPPSGKHWNLQNDESAPGYSGGLGLRSKSMNITAPATDAAREWQGWGTALKPAHEPIVLARKPLAGTVAANVMEHGTGALNIDGCRIEAKGGSPAAARRDTSRRTGTVSTRPGEYNRPLQDRTSPERYTEPRAGEAIGRWPANVLLDEVAAAMLDEQSETLQSGAAPATGFVRNSDKHRNTYGAFAGNREEPTTLHGDTGGASRFFYVAKASRSERDAGLLALPKREAGVLEGRSDGSQGAVTAARRNHHPTVKPVELMRHLVRLVTPPGGAVLDPYLGSGSTGVAAVAEGVRFIGIEREPEYLEIARRRIISTPLSLELAS